MVFKKIKSLKKISENKKVYNFDVPIYENYIANGFVVHNCYNYSVSQDFGSQSLKQVSAYELVKKAEDEGVDGIAFTYNEPTLFYKYIKEVAWICLSAQNNLKLVVKTNGFCGHTILRDLIMYVDAFNVDIKGDSHEYSLINGRLQPVLENIKTIHNAGVWVEISYLVTNHNISDNNFHNSMASYLSGINKNIPVHILYMYPFHKRKEFYEKKEIISVYEIFKEKMKYVYLSNLFGEQFSDYRNTECDTCNDIMIAREQGVLIFKKECCSKKVAGIM